MVTKKNIFLIIGLLTLPGSVAAKFVSRTMINNGTFQGTNQVITVREDLTNNGTICTSESIYIEAGDLRGAGSITAPKITILAKKFNFTGTITCTQHGTIITQEPVDRSKFKLTGEGVVEFRVQPNLTFDTDEPIESHQDAHDHRAIVHESAKSSVARSITQKEFLEKTHNYLTENLLKLSPSFIKSAIDEVKSCDGNKSEILSQLKDIIAAEKDNAKQLINKRNTTALKLGVISFAVTAASIGAIYLIYKKWYAPCKQELSQLCAKNGITAFSYETDNTTGAMRITDYKFFGEDHYTSVWAWPGLKSMPIDNKGLLKLAKKLDGLFDKQLTCGTIGLFTTIGGFLGIKEWLYPDRTSAQNEYNQWCMIHENIEHAIKEQKNG